MSIRKLVRMMGRSGRDVLVAALVIVSLMLSSFSPANAAGGVTGNVQGSVADEVSGAPIVGAKITLSAPTGTFKAVTDSKGGFSILGINADTYTISVEAPGHESLVQTGVNVIGDQNVNVGVLKLGLKVIGKVTVGNPSGVFRPNSTTDTYNISGAKLLDTVGKANSTNEDALVLSAPGVTLTDSGGITIRGGLQTEVGYNLDGIPYNEPFLNGNASGGRFSGVSSVQIVEGSGDASQGNVSGGAVNLITKRGTYPGFGTLDAEIGGPNSYQQGALEYGIATRDNRFSNYFSYTQSNEHPYYGVRGTDVTQNGYAGAADHVLNQDLIDNFVFKFGHNLNQSLNVEYENRNLRDFGFASGTYSNGANPIVYGQSDPLTGRLSGVVNTGLAAQDSGVPSYLVPFLPYQTSLTGQLSNNAQTAYNPTTLLKFEYDNTIDANDAVQLKVFKTEFQNGSAGVTGGSNPFEQVTGGQNAGLIFDFQRQVGSRYTLSVNATGQDNHPQWNGYYPYQLLQLINGTQTPVGGNGIAPASGGFSPSIADFFTPVNGQCPVDGGCYLSNYLTNIPRIPTSGIDYHGSQFKQFGLGLRNQYQFGTNVKADLGVRYEGAIYDFGVNRFNNQGYDAGNPQDVPPSFLNNAFTNPRVIEPRGALTWEINRDNSVNVNYGRSAIFLTAQTAGTPSTLYNYGSLINVPATDTAANPACGSGTNPRGFFKCPNYAAQLYWLYDQNFDAPDLGADTTEISSNYGFSYQHQFKGGYGLKFAPFYKLSTGTPSFAVKSETVDPNTGAITSEVFTANNLGLNRTTGAEFALSTPDRKYGASGFLSATYQNVIDSTPPLLSDEDVLPIIGTGSLALGDLYRAGYVSPASFRIGGDYKFKNGIRVSPVLQYDIGYPYSVGTTTASTHPIAGAFRNVIQSNNANAVNSVAGAFGATGSQLATQYVDPANPGSALNPNIAATRGTPATASAGGKLSPANLEGDLTIEYKNGRNTFGIQAINVFGNQFNGSIPEVNPYYQPVSTGVSGPQTGKLKQANPAYANGDYIDRGYSNLQTNTYAFTNGAYLLTPGAPTHFTFYYQLGL